MADNIDLTFLARQMERLLSAQKALQDTVNLVRRRQERMLDDLGLIKSDLNTMRQQIAALEVDLRNGFDALDARMRPLENDE